MCTQHPERDKEPRGWQRPWWWQRPQRVTMTLAGDNDPACDKDPRELQRPYRVLMCRNIFEWFLLRLFSIHNLKKHVCYSTRRGYWVGLFLLLLNYMCPRMFQGWSFLVFSIFFDTCQKNFVFENAGLSSLSVWVIIYSFVFPVVLSGLKFNFSLVFQIFFYSFAPSHWVLNLFLCRLFSRFPINLAFSVEI